MEFHNMFNPKMGYRSDNFHEIFRQSRIKDGCDKLTNCFTFCPNKMITGKIFLEFITNNHLFLYGGYGIGKTASIVLLSLISLHINSFYFHLQK